MQLSTAVDRNCIEQSEPLFDRFCQRLVDSNGYFRIFPDESSPNSWATPREYAMFETTTATAMAFNDEHARDQHVGRSRTKRQLARVAYPLETRFELEDDIIARERDRLAPAS